jgi:CheY-like chemotaxis protein
MADSLLCIVAQRLVKRLCPDCREVGPITDEERALLEPFTDEVPEEVARPVGCPRCRNGYRGRIGIQEMLVFDTEVRDWVRSGVPTSQIRGNLIRRGDRLAPSLAIDKVRALDLSPLDAHESVLSEEEEATKQSRMGSSNVYVSPPDGPPLQDDSGIGFAEREETPDGHLMIGSDRAPRIVIADDDEDTRELLVRVLAHAGYEVLPAMDGIEALGLVDRNEVDMVITDAHMPGLDGLGLLRTLAEKYPLVPVMLLTGTAEADAEAEALRMGAADYVRKPTRRDVLLLRVERAFRNAQRHQQGE